MQVDFWKFHWKHQSKGVKFNIGLALLGGVAILALLALFLNRYQIDVLISPAPEPSVENPEPELPPPVTFASAATTPTPGSPLWNPQPPSPAPAIAGKLRVSNQTQHPIRVVLLQQTPADAVDTADRPNDQVKYQATSAHWDFAPAEGSRDGLVVSLPEGKIKIAPGDILMVYAQDGSTRYWGPWVVSQTQLPLWNSQQQEWQIILRP